MHFTRYQKDIPDATLIPLAPDWATPPLFNKSNNYSFQAYLHFSISQYSFLREILTCNINPLKFLGTSWSHVSLSILFLPQFHFHLILHFIVPSVWLNCCPTKQRCNPLQGPFHWSKLLRGVAGGIKCFSFWSLQCTNTFLLLQYGRVDFLFSIQADFSTFP